MLVSFSLAHFDYRGISDDTKAWEVTKNINTARYPLCADPEARSRLPEYFKSLGFSDINHWVSSDKSHKNIDRKPGCLYCRALKAMFKKHENPKRLHEIDIDYQFWELPKEQRTAILETHGLKFKGLKTASPRLPLHRCAADSSDDANLSQQDNFHIDPAVGHHYQAFSASGPSTASWDAWKSTTWDLATHAGFFTWPHHDAAGFSSYVFTRVGCKIWGILRPKITESDKYRSHLFDKFRNILRPSPANCYESESDLFNIFLLPGDVL